MLLPLCPTFTRAHAKLLLFALALTLGCGDGYIGRECPPGSPDCAEPGQGSQVESLEVSFQEYPPVDLAPFKVTGSISTDACNATCASDAGLLLPATGDGVWSLPRGGQPSRLQLLGADGGLEERLVPPPPPEPIADVKRFATTNAAGDAVLRLQWDVARDRVAGPGRDEIAIVQTNGTVSRVTVDDSGSFTRLPLGVLPVPAGFLLFESVRGLAMQAQLVAPDGSRSWQLRTLPREATAAGGAAAPIRSGGFMLAAHPLGSREASLGLLQLTSSGTVARYAMPESAWRDVRMLALGGGEFDFALVAQADKQTALATSDGTGNLELVRFALGREAVGVRIMRECYHAMTINGFAKDPAGNLFVSTVGGDRRESRPMICRYSTASVPHCFEGERGTVLGEIVAISATTLYAASGDQILRIELPTEAADAGTVH